MADISDVETAIVSLISSLVYPNGTSSPSAVIGGAGQAMPVRVYRGWPAPAALDADLSPDLVHALRAGIMNISVFSRGATEHNTTRYALRFENYLPLPAPTITATVSSNTVTLGGTLNRNIIQYATILIGPRVAVSYAPTETDTLATAATALASLIVNNGTFSFPATASGNTITIATGSPIIANVGVGSTTAIAEEVRRQNTQVQITIWSPSPVARDNAAKLIEPTLANTPFLLLPDNTQCRFRYHNTMVIDQPEKVLLYRRDLIYNCEYATILIDSAFQVTSTEVDVRGSQGDLGTAPDNVFVYPETPVTTNPLPPTPLVAEIS